MLVPHPTAALRANSQQPSPPCFTAHGPTSCARPVLALSCDLAQAACGRQTFMSVGVDGGATFRAFCVSRCLRATCADRWGS